MFKTSLLFKTLVELTKMTYPNGMRTEISYEGDTRLSKVEHIKTGLFDKVQSQFSYQYDNNDNKTRMKTFRRALPVNETLNYTYDKKNQLLTATNPLRNLAEETFTYDITGNLLKQTTQTTNSNYNENNQLTEDETYTYKYDIKGNMTERKYKTNNTITRYEWDIENQLTKVTTHETETAMPSETITYAYDALGRRIEKNINGKVKQYIYDNEDILAEFTGEGLFQKYYVHGMGIDNPLAMLDRDSNDLNNFITYYYHKDGMGSITSLTDKDKKEVEKYVYDAFGKMTIYDERDNKIEESQLQNLYSFTGREHDSETGLHYHRARYYAPELARWISEDPIEFNAGDMNLYRYTFNSPMKWLDPFGDKTFHCRRVLDNALLQARDFKTRIISHSYTCNDENGQLTACQGFQPEGLTDEDQSLVDPEDCEEVDPDECSEEGFDNCVAKNLMEQSEKKKFGNYSFWSNNCHQFLNKLFDHCRDNCGE